MVAWIHLYDASADADPYLCRKVEHDALVPHPAPNAAYRGSRNSGLRNVERATNSDHLHLKAADDTYPTIESVRHEVTYLPKLRLASTLEPPQPGER